MKILGSLTRVISLVFRQNSQDITFQPSSGTTYTAARIIELPPGDAAHILTSATSTQTLSNKTISGSSNTITNVSLSAGVTGVLPVANGGTNSSTTLNNNRVVQSSGGALVEAAAITAARALISDANGIPTQSSVTSATLAFLDATSSVQTQLNATEKTANKGVANGYAGLDAGGKVPVAQLPNSIMEFQGVWNATTNTPTLADGTGHIGDVYRVNVAGTQNLGSGSQTFIVGDWAVLDAGLIWRLAHAGADAVVSVNGAAGVVTVNAINQLTGDVTAGPASGSASAVATIAAGAITDSKVNAAAAIAVSKLAAGTNTFVLTTTGGVPVWAAPAASVSSFKTTWITSDGTTKTVTHSLGSTDVIVQLFDITDGQSFEPDSVIRTSTSVVTVTASVAPGASGYRVLVLAI